MDQTYPWQIVPRQVFTPYDGRGGGSGGAMVLGKLSVPGRPANLDYSRARVSALAVGRVGIVWTICLSSIISLLSPSLWETTR